MVNAISGVSGGSDSSQMDQWEQLLQMREEDHKPSSCLDSIGDHSSTHQFFPDMPMTKAENAKFMSNEYSELNSQIKQDQQEQKEASKELKKSEDGQS